MQHSSHADRGPPADRHKETALPHHGGAGRHSEQRHRHSTESHAAGSAEDSDVRSEEEPDETVVLRHGEVRRGLVPNDGDTVLRRDESTAAHTAEAEPAAESVSRSVAEDDVLRGVERDQNLGVRDGSDVAGASEEQFPHANGRRVVPLVALERNYDEDHPEPHSAVDLERGCLLAESDNPLVRRVVELPLRCWLGEVGEHEHHRLDVRQPVGQLGEQGDACSRTFPPVRDDTGNKQLWEQTDGHSVSQLLGWPRRLQNAGAVLPGQNLGAGL